MVNGNCIILDSDGFDKSITVSSIPFCFCIFRGVQSQHMTLFYTPVHNRWFKNRTIHHRTNRELCRWKQPHCVSIRVVCNIFTFIFAYMYVCIDNNHNNNNIWRNRLSTTNLARAHTKHDATKHDADGGVYKIRTYFLFFETLEYFHTVSIMEKARRWSIFFIY